MPRKLGIVSHVFPPTWSGQSRVLCLLLKDVPPEQYVLLSSCPDYGKCTTAEGYIGSLPGKRIELSPSPADPPPNPGWLRSRYEGLRRRLGWHRAPSEESLRWRTERICEVARQESCRALIGCSGDVLDLPATFRASQALEVPFFAYYFDWYAQQWTHPADRAFALASEGQLLKSAAGVIVPNEALADELAGLYGIQARVIHNPCDTVPEGDLPEPDSAGDGEVRIVYTGAIYEAQLDALCNVARAIELLGKPEIRLHLYTACGASGMGARTVSHPHIAPSKIRTVHQEADILVLPLSFHTRYPAVIRTSAPGKTGEYLAAGRPILVHAPAGSFVSSYFRRHGCGMVVEEDSPRAVADALRQLLADAELRKRISSAARQRARSDFDARRVAAEFLQTVFGEQPAWRQTPARRSQ